MLKLLLLLDLVVLLFMAPVARADDSWIVDTITDRAQAHGVSAATMVCMAWRESTGTLDRFNPSAVGRLGEQGLFQIMPVNGLGPLFYRMGYSSPFNVWEAADFTAWALSQGMGRHWTTRSLC